MMQVEHVMNEAHLLGVCDHPFLINLVALFQDQVEVYMVLELALGGEQQIKSWLAGSIPQ